MGEDVDREGIESTPMRAAKALQFFTKGYCQTVKGVVGEGIFNEQTQSDMVLVKNIEIHSLCEVEIFILFYFFNLKLLKFITSCCFNLFKQHHMVPFSGKVHIAYIPNGKILGLSKLARIADVFARRLQVQERLTRQIAEAIMELISPQGVGVMIEAT
jgi:GTP cyclohydrolase I